MADNEDHSWSQATPAFPCFLLSLSETIVHHCTALAPGLALCRRLVIVPVIGLQHCPLLPLLSTNQGSEGLTPLLATHAGGSGLCIQEPAAMESTREG